MKKLLIVIVCILFMGFTQSEENILFVGDSLTAYKGGWQHQFSKLRHFSTYDNISKGGKRTKWMLEQIKKYPEECYKYNVVMIYGGINDSFSSVPESQTINNIQQMVYHIKKMGAVPIVIIGYSPEKVIKNTMYSKEVEDKCRKRYISLQNRMQKELKWCVIIPKDTTIDRSDSDDGIHLKASGHKKFAKWVFNNY